MAFEIIKLTYLLTYSKCATLVKQKHFCRLHNSDGADKPFAWTIHKFPSCSKDNSTTAPSILAGSIDDTRTVLVILRDAESLFFVGLQL